MTMMTRNRRMAFRPVLFWMCVLLATAVLTACLYGSPDESDVPDGQSTIVYPDTGGILSSPDGRMYVQFPAGVVDRPTSFAITILDQASFPEQDRLVSPVYQIEPTRPLNEVVRVTVDLFGLDGGEYDLTELYGTGAMALQQVLPGERNKYVETSEANWDAPDGTVHRVLLHNTDRLGGYGVFIHDLYKLCEISVDCPDYPLNPGRPRAERIRTCMEQLGGTEDIEKMNSDAMAATFACAYERPCEDSYGCCLDNPECPETDGDADDTDQDVLPDGDPDTVDDDPDAIDADESEDGDLDPDVTEEDPDTDTDGDEEQSFEVKTCETDEDCGAMSCALDLRLDRDIGYCLPISDGLASGYVRGDTAWERGPDDLSLLCIGNEPSQGGIGPSDFEMKVKIGDWWEHEILAGINVRMYYEQNLERPAATCITNEQGECLFDQVFPDTWMVFETERESENPRHKIVTTFDWGYLITKPRAKEAVDAGVPVTVDVHPLNQDRYNSYTVALGLSGVPDGFGMVIGKVMDCHSDEPYALSNVNVGFVEFSPVVTGYFSSQLNNPTPMINQLSTNRNGLFIGVYLPPAEELTAFAFGRMDDGGSGSVELLGLSNFGHLRLERNSVSIVRINSYQ